MRQFLPGPAASVAALAAAAVLVTGAERKVQTVLVAVDSGKDVLARV